MINQINWTALPGGRHNTSEERTRLTLFASLRIENPPECPEIFDWPATLASLRFRVLFESGDPVGLSEEAGTLRRVSTPAPSSPMWVETFGHVLSRPALLSANRARATAELLSNPSRIASFDARAVASGIDAIYRRSLQQQARAIPSAEQPVGLLGAFDSVKAVSEALNTFAKKINMEAFSDFYRPTESGVLRQDDGDEPFDFGETLALLCQYPFLMRLYGVAVDFELDSSAAQLPASGRVRIEPLSNLECPTASMWTAYQSSTHGDNVLFTARPRDPAQYRNGFLFLGADSPYQVLPEDLDGQTMKLDSLMKHLDLGEESGGPPETDLPAQRTVGLTFIHSGRAEQLVVKTRTANTLLASTESAGANGGVAGETLFLEDVSQALRPDVKRDDRSFLSLCARNVDFRVGDEEFIEIKDEGFITGITTQSDNQVRVHEALFRFDGYGLCVDRPFATADGVSDTSDDTTGLRVKTVPRPIPNTLPALRYGNDYRFAVRIVDIAGGGLTLEDTATLLDTGAPVIDDAISPPVKFLRREPVASPLVFAVAELEAGESSDHIAIRTDSKGCSEGARRHLLPPRVAPEVVERSGILDGMSADDVFDLLDERDVQLEEEVYPEGRFEEVPYLADPIARHARLEFVGLPGHDEPIVLVVPFQNSGWPRANGILLELESGYKPPEVTGDDRPVVRVELPPGCTTTVLLQSIPDPADLETTFMHQYDIADNPVHVAHPALAPAREIRLVHAVEQPLAVPAFTEPRALPRGSSDTFVQIDDQLAVDVKSTGRITCLARWENPIDAPSLNREQTPALPGREPRSAEAFSFPLEASLENVLLAQGGIDHNGNVIPNRHQIGATGHRRVEYRVVAETRFSAFFPDSDDGDRRLESAPVTVDVPNAARPAALSIRHVVPIFEWQGDEECLGRKRWWSFDDIKPVIERRRLGRRLRVYLERPCLLSGFQEKLGVVLWPAPLGDLAEDETGCLRKVVTQWALDPIWKSASLPDGPFARHFPLADTVMHGIELEEIPELSRPAEADAEQECSVAAGRLANRVVVAGHALHFDPDADAWYADIEIDSDAAYFPFVRLGLVRFQPLSQPGFHASSLSFADFAQLAPDRFLTLSYANTPRPMIEVSLVGPGYEPRSDNRPGAIIEVQLEKPRFCRTDAAWEPASDNFILTQAQLPNGRMAWSGTLHFPPDPGSDLRLTVREFEQFREPETGLVRRRLTYSDMVPALGDSWW